MIRKNPNRSFVTGTPNDMVVMLPVTRKISVAIMQRLVSKTHENKDRTNAQKEIF
ncbi:MAG TPA: hypothetical protein VH396_06495 [Chitinophagaceae bacterium]